MSLKIQSCGLRPQFHPMHVGEMEVQTIAWGGRSSMQLQHKRPGAGGPAADGGTKSSGWQLMFPAEGSTLQEVQHAIHLCSLQTWGFQVKS